MGDPLKPDIELSITPGERLPMETIYQQRAREQLLEEQYNRINLNPESDKTAQSAEGGQAMSQPKTPIASPLESTSEQVRARATAQMQMPAYQKVLGTVTKSVLGLSLEDLQKAIDTGGLPQHVNLNMLGPGQAVASDVIKNAARQQAIDSGLPPDVAETIAGTTGMLAGILFPAGGFKKKGEAALKGARVLSAESKQALQRFLAGEVPEAQSKVNLARVGAEDSVKTTMSTLNKFNAERLASSRATVSHAATVAASEGAMTIEKALRLPDADFVLDKDKGTALRDLYASTSTRLTHLKNRMLQGDTAVEGEFLDTFLIAQELARKDELVGRGVARALEARKIQSDAGRAPISLADIQKLRERFGEMTGVSASTLAGMLDQLDTPEKKRTFLGLVGQGLSQGQSMLYEAWVNALLSGPQTHAANTLSNAMTAAWAPAERFLAANLDFAADRSVFRGESAAMLYGVIEGMKKGLRASVKAMQTGVSEFGEEKVERVGAISAASIGLNPNTALGAAADYFGALVRIPGRALMSEDAFFKALNYQLELHAYSYRTAMQEGGGTPWRRMQELIHNPPPAVHARAEQFALVQTFNQDLSELGFVGQMGSGLMTAAEAVPMGRVVLPFVRTPTNLLHFTMERTPILNALSDTLRADIAAGGERRALAFGKVASGLMAAGGVASLAAAGLISGGGPSDKTLLANKKLTGWQPYSIQIDGKWVAYNRLDPLGMMIGMMADYADIAGEIPEGRRVEYAAAIGLAVSQNMLSKTYLQGLSDLFEAMKDPEKGSEKYVRSLTRSLVPAASRQLERATDPVARETRALKEVDTLLNELKAGVPGYAHDLPPRRNLWGDPIELNGGWGPDLISPIYTSPVKDDPVAHEIVRLKVALALPQPIMFGGRQPRDLQFQEPRPSQQGVPLTPGEYDLLLHLTGKGLPGGVPLHDELERFMRSPDYATLTDGPDGTKALAISRIVNAYKTAARGAMLDPNINPGADALAEQLQNKVNEKVKALTPSATNTSPGPFDVGNLLKSLGR